MSVKEKLLKRFLSKPKDFTYPELVKLLKFFGYEENTGGKTGGSSRSFVNDEKKVIFLHEPHPGNILKSYAIRNVINHLQENGDIDE